MDSKRFFQKFGYGFCIATAAALLISDGTTINAHASSYSKNSGLAGISLFMDSFYSTNDNKVAETGTGDELPVDEVLAASVSDSLSTPSSIESGLAGFSAAGNVFTPVTDAAVSDSAVSAASVSADAEDKEEEEAEETQKSKDELQEDESAVVSKYKNIGISNADPYVNIRQKPGTDSKIVAKLYKGSKCDIVKRVDGWVKIESGNAKGYIKAEYLDTGDDAEKLISKYANKFAVAQTETLNVRYNPSTKSRIATQVPMGEKLLITKSKKNWYEISIDNTITGWVSKDYVKVKIAWKHHAVTLKEEREAAERKARAEQAIAAQQAVYGNGSSSYAASQNDYSSYSAPAASTYVGDSSSTSANGTNIANFACQFVGNPYVWGGTSLTNGADCSGFVQSVYRNFGYYLNRTAASQTGNGSSVSLSSLQPGDLVFYSANGGSISHVALYIGGGQVVHASTPQTGIIISSVNHMTPVCARRIVN